jgi:magnesium transporter
MSEFKFFYQKEGLVRISRNLELLKKIPTEQLLWIDLNDVDEEIESQLEDFLKIYIQEEEEMIEIETSSRYIETRDTLVVNANFLLKTYDKSPVSFILKNHILISVRSEDLGSFTETVKKIFANPENYPTGYHVFLSLLETRIEFDADMIEEITQ